MSLTDDLSDRFFEDLIDLCARLRLQPVDLLAVMNAESAVRANAQSSISNASGLIQFLPRTLQGLGWTETHQQFRQLDADQQLPYVERFLQPYVHFGLGSAARVYQAVFLPASLPLGSDPDTVIVQQGGINGSAYAGNRSLDTNQDGAITVGELDQALQRHMNTDRWHEIETRLNRISGGDGGAPNESDPGGASGAIDLRTTTGVSDGLEALGFDRNSSTLANAVRDFQQQEGLAVDGIAGRDTIAALARALQDSGIAVIA